MDRIKDHLTLEDEFVSNQERLRSMKEEKGGLEQRQEEERGRVDDMRGSPMGVGNLEEMIDDDHAIVSSTTGPEYVVVLESLVTSDDNTDCIKVLRIHHVVCRQRPSRAWLFGASSS